MEFRASRASVETLREARSAGATVTLHLHGGASFTGVIRDVSEHQVVLAAPEAWGIFHVSSVTREGLTDVLEALWARVQEEKREERGDEERFPELEEWAR